MAQESDEYSLEESYYVLALLLHYPWASAAEHCHRDYSIRLNFWLAHDRQFILLGSPTGC